MSGMDTQIVEKPDDVQIKKFRHIKLTANSITAL